MREPTVNVPVFDSKSILSLVASKGMNSERAAKGVKLPSPARRRIKKVRGSSARCCTVYKSTRIASQGGGRRLLMSLLTFGNEHGRSRKSIVGFNFSRSATAATQRPANRQARPLVAQASLSEIENVGEIRQILQRAPELGNAIQSFKPPSIAFG